MQLMNVSENLTMSSIDIAVLTEKRHSDVVRVIDLLMQKKHYRGYAKISYTHEQNGQTYQKYEINKRDSFVVVAQLSPEFTARLVDRWQELEQTNKFQIPQTLSQALMLAAQQAEQIEQQQLLIEQQRPAVEFVDRYVEARATKGIREVAKILGQKEKEFVADLIDRGILFRQGRALLPYASYQHKGYFEVKTGEQHGHAFHQTKFTPSGIAWIVE